MKQALRADNQQPKIPLSTLPPDSFETLYNQYVGKVYQKCLSMTKDAEAAQDFTQDIFIKVFHKIGSFENRSTFATWLYSVSHNYCLDQIKIGKRRSTESLTDGVLNTVAELDQSASVELRLQQLEGLMNGLPAEEINLLRLKYEQGLSIKEIARQYELTESGVKMRLKRTRDKLYKLYG